MNTTIKKIKTFQLSEIKWTIDIKYYNYYKYNSETHVIMKSPELNCIYKILSVPDDKEIIMYETQKSSTWDSEATNNWYTLLVEDVNDQRSSHELKFIYLLTDSNPVITVERLRLENNKNYVYATIGNISLIIDINTRKNGMLTTVLDKKMIKFMNFSISPNNVDYKIDDYYYDVPISNIIRSLGLSADHFNKFIGLRKNDMFRINLSKATGITKLLKSKKEFIDRLKSEYPYYHSLLQWFFSQSNRTVDKAKVSKVLNESFGKLENYQDFVQILSNITEQILSAEYNIYSEGIIGMLPKIKEIRRDAHKKGSNRAFKKMFGEFKDFEVDGDKFPETRKAINNGEFPIGIFFKKSEGYFLINDNWQLWEEMLILNRKLTLKLAHEASHRNMYERDLMSYFYFILYGLPRYLNKHAPALRGDSWKCFPKLVDSSKELEPVQNKEGETTKTRSALTPIVDNKKHEVIVPYASLKIDGGQGTTYCYAHNFHVLQEGYVYEGNTCMRDLELMLNGKDDYGLMYYTLTGSPQGRGYPSFLIIFENLGSKADSLAVGVTSSKNVKIHFHRVHPYRSKDGDANPVHHWIKTCYNWMSGNVNLSTIKTTQGDLVFVKTDQVIPEDQFQEVNGYDNHLFVEPIQFAPYIKKKKDNILGYIKLNKELELTHPEHLNRLVPAGLYEVRQVRSWEANPKGVWSLRID